MGAHGSKDEPKPSADEASTDSFQDNPPKKGLRKKLALKEPIDFLKDDPKTMTFSRRLVLNHLMKYKWYNPKASGINRDDIDPSADGNKAESSPSGPSLQVAWAYFEHLSLPRYLVPPDGEPLDTKKVDVAVPGEQFYETRLYNHFTSSPAQMADLGIAVGMYFATLRALTVILFIAGLINIPKILYYAGEEYSDYQQGMSWFLKGSAVCNVHEWVPCVEDCLANSPLVRGEEFRSQTIGDVTFVLKNSCDGALFRLGILNLATILFVILAFVILAYYLHRIHTDFDVDEQTAQDYAICIRNPPPDARDPNEWKEFFESKFSDCEGGAHVTTCTVGVNNDELVRLAVKRREILRAIKYAIPDEFKDREDIEMSLDELTSIVDKKKSEKGCFQSMMTKVFGASKLESTYDTLLKVNRAIEEECHANSDGYPVTNIFVMFETETAQRYILENMSVSPYNAIKNNLEAVKNDKYLFRGNLVLDVREAKEPSTIRWQELNVTTKDLVVKVLLTMLVLGMLVGVGYTVKVLNEISLVLGTTAITVSNLVFPTIAKMIIGFERHPREEELQLWLYIKIAFFRWVNTAVVITLITPFTATVQPDKSGLIPKIFSLYVAEIITVNLFQYIDIMSTINKHFTAPRASTQEEMNLCFSGTRATIAESYTITTKILFFAMWYAPLFPGGLFLAAIALYANYVVDRFSFTRSWARQAKIGPAISKFTGLVSYPLTVVLMTFVATASWAGFPYDYLCETSTTVSDNYHGLYILEPDVMISNSTNTSIELDDSSSYYEFCSRAQWRSASNQERLVSIFSIFSYVLVAIVVIGLSIPLFQIIKSYFVVSYEPIGEDQKIPFRDVLSIISYIPQVNTTKIAYPLIVCNTDQIIDSGLFGWDDPLRDYDYYDVTKDVDTLLNERTSNADHIKKEDLYSIIRYWPYHERKG